MSETAFIEDFTFESKSSIQSGFDCCAEPRSMFQTTRWSLVAAAGQSQANGGQKALEELCRAYWFPLYSFVRRYGHSAEDAQDLTQEFFARYLENDSFVRADRRRGKFRTYLLTSLKNFLHEQWKRARRQKKWNGQMSVPLDTEEAESRYLASGSTSLTPDRVFERRWAESILERTLTQLRSDYSSTGRAAVYEQLQHLLWGREPELSYAQMGARLNMNEGAVKVAVHRLRQRFRDLLRAEVALTVEGPGEVEDELRYLMGLFAGCS